MRSSAGVRAVLGLLLLPALACCSAPTEPGPAFAPTPTRTPTPAATSAALPGVDCARSVRTGPLPEWARGGFSDDGSSFRHVEGLDGRVVGVLFGYPLSAPPRPDRANKILWVAREPGSGRLRISARLDGSGLAVEREVGFGGGQSIIDLPRAGCWRFTLTWGDRRGDVVDVPHLARR